jgi:CHASE1-domain containing sensor protein
MFAATNSQAGHAEQPRWQRAASHMRPFTIFVLITSATWNLLEKLSFAMTDHPDDLYSLLFVALFGLSAALAVVTVFRSQREDKDQSTFLSLVKSLIAVVAMIGLELGVVFVIAYVNGAFRRH